MVTPPSTNPDPFQGFIDALNGAGMSFSDQVERSAARFAREATGFFNPVDRLRDSIRRLDKTNQLALKQGISVDRLRTSINKNSDVLTRGLVSNQKVIEAIVQNTESGIRIQSGALVDLTEEMVATGQDLTGLRQSTSNLLLFTGENTDAVQRAIRVNQDVSDKYGVSNDKLIQSVNSLRDTFEEASFFGGDTTASLQELATQLKGRTGGKEVEGAIRTLFQLGTGGVGNIGAAVLTGAQGFRARIAAGQQVGLSDIQPILERISQIAETSRGVGGGLGIGADIAAARTGLSKQQVNQLLLLNEQLKRNFELDKDVKATDDEKFNTVINIEQRAKNFYDNTAISTLAALGTANTTLIGIAAAIGQAGGFGGALKNFDLGRNTAPAKGIMGMLGKGGAGLLAGAAGGLAINAVGAAAGVDTGAAATGATLGATIGSIIPGVGTLIGGAAGAGIGLLVDIVSNTEKTAEELEKERREREEERQRERAAENARNISRLDFLAGYIRTRGGSFMTDPEMRDLLQGIKDAVELSNRNNPAGFRTTATKP